MTVVRVGKRRKGNPGSSNTGMDARYDISITGCVRGLQPALGNK